MNLQQAKREVSALANGKCHGVGYELREYSSKDQSQECSIYLQDVGMFSAPTFKQALTLLKKAMNPKRYIFKDRKPQTTIAESITDAPRTTVQQHIDNAGAA